MHVSIDNDGDLGALECPKCKGQYLHQRAVVSTFRDKEDGDGTEVRHTANVTASRRVRDNDIPGRRDVCLLFFECEGCSFESGEMFMLRIMQHKGQTFVEWVEKEDWASHY